MGSWIRRSHFLFLVPFAIKPVPPFLLFFFVRRTCHHFPHGFMCFVSRVHKVRSTLRFAISMAVSASNASSQPPSPFIISLHVNDFIFAAPNIAVSTRAFLSASTTYFQSAKYQSVRETLASHAGLLQNGSIRVGV